MAVIDLHHGILHHVVLEPLELEVQNGWELLEDDTLLGLLEAVPFGIVLVVTLEGLHLNVVVKGLLEVLQPLHIELDVYKLIVFRAVGDLKEKCVHEG